MRYFAVAFAAASLLLASGSARAVQFNVPRVVVPADDVTAADAAEKWTIGVAAASWGFPDQGGVEFDAKVRPLLSVDYQINDKWSVGGWYNAFGLDASSGAVTVSADGSVYELHATYGLPKGFAVQAGYMASDIDFTVPGFGTTNATSEEITLWGMKNFAVGGERLPLNLLAAVGASFADSDTFGHAQLGLSYAFAPKFSADASVWFYNLTGDSAEQSTRFTAGVTGRF